jgi:hypothetical protein
MPEEQPAKRKISNARTAVISLRFWRRSPRRSDYSTASNTAANSAISGVSPPAALDRKAARNSRFELIAALSVVVGIVAEDWDEFFKFYDHPNWSDGRVAIGGALVALGIIAEIWFSSRSASAEREIRDWYALRVSELNLKAEQEQLARVELEASLRDRQFMQDSVSQALLMRFPEVAVRLEYLDERECKSIAEQINFVLWAAQWNVISGAPILEESRVHEGITVSFGSKQPDLSDRNVALSALQEFSKIKQNTMKAVECLISELRKSGLVTKNGIPDWDAPPTAIVIRVWRKPSPLQNRFGLKRPFGADGSG